MIADVLATAFALLAILAALAVAVSFLRLIRPRRHR